LAGECAIVTQRNITTGEGVSRLSTNTPFGCVSVVGKQNGRHYTTIQYFLGFIQLEEVRPINSLLVSLNVPTEIHSSDASGVVATERVNIDQLLQHFNIFKGDATPKHAN
jgi:hypothetical protein